MWDTNTSSKEMWEKQNMLETRRHSIDVPLSKTLVALRRVRSLRDPSTNSLCKFTAFGDNMNWETNSCTGAFLGLENMCGSGGLDSHGLLGSPNFHSDRILEEFGSEIKLDSGSLRKPSIQFIASERSGSIQISHTDLIKMKKDDQLEISKSNVDGFCDSRLFSERDGRDHRSNGMDLMWIPHSTSFLTGGAVLCNEQKAESAQSEGSTTVVLRRKSDYVKPTTTSGPVEDTIRSPCPSVSDAWMDALSVSMPLFATGEVDDMHPNHHDCGISHCWSRTPKFREPTLPSDAEGLPVSSMEGKEMPHLGKQRCSAHFKKELSILRGTSRSLSQKFMPRSFGELVGQHAVTQSLLQAIKEGKVASFCLFHGPRGTGKTSTSRIFAAALNCLSNEEPWPCGLCRECILFFSGRGWDVKEVDAVKTNCAGMVKALMKNAALAPVSSRFKVFIIEECQMLQAETWAAFLNSLEELPGHAVFVMITSDLDKLPRCAVSRCQRYQFLKIRDVDIVSRLQKICIAEGLDFDEVALDFIASKSNGSLRDAETMLDQLSLLDERITTSLTYELVGVVSNDELLDLLDLALSSDASNTVRKARELMRSRVDPMQLISQLANLIMDILAGRGQSGSSELRKKFFGTHISEGNLQKLKYALKILSETEKQLRASKNQTTWLTAALLQFNAGETPFMLDANDSSACLETADAKDDGFCSTFLGKNGLNSSVSFIHNPGKSHQSEMHGDKTKKLETIWQRTLEKCQSIMLRRFLQKEGKLSSILLNQGLAIAEVEFCHPDHVSKAEKYWKLIAGSFELVLGCNVEIIINLRPCTERRHAKEKRALFNLLSCSCRKQEKSVSSSENGDSYLDSSTLLSEKPLKRETDKATDFYHSSMHEPGASHDAICFHHKDVVTIRNAEGNALNSERARSCGTAKDDVPCMCKVKIYSSRERKNRGYSAHEPETQPNCFSKTFKLKRFLRISDAACLRFRPKNDLELFVPKKASIETFYHMGGPNILCSSPNSRTTCCNTSVAEDG